MAQTANGDGSLETALCRIRGREVFFMEYELAQQQLEAVYDSWKHSVKFSKEESDLIGPPLLLHITPEYWNAEHRILIYGQETYGWWWTREHLHTLPGYPPWTFKDVSTLSQFLSNEDSVKALCWGYKEFKFGLTQKLGGTPFWRAFRDIQKWPNASLMWSNVLRTDCTPRHFAKDPGIKLKDLNDKMIEQQEFVLRNELEILKPDVCIFFSGPYYDHIIRSAFPNTEFSQCTNVPERELGLLSGGLLPGRTFRTFHPNYLSRAKKWEYIEQLRALANFVPHPVSTTPSAA
jgi:hypothetical protein